ncbi:MAG: oxaloacetate decarboxylase [Deltaproteobacteria bacterium]|nr:oxaloacetate decarboxylase [Deltaproteobacteria bacterium]
MARKTTLLKQYINEEAILVMPGAFDSLSARIIEKVGFKAVTLGGYPLSATTLGKPDVSLLTLTEMVDHARNVAGALDIPLFADGDTGHGNVINVQRTVREFEKAGVAGLFIEDQVFPKRCGHMEGKQVIPAPEMVAKIKAAVDTRNDEDMTIMARTDALAVYGLDEAIERANIYREAGADLIFIEAPPDVSDMRRITREVQAPTVANMIEGGKTPLLRAAELQEIGYSVVVFPLSCLYAAAKTVWTVMQSLHETGSTGESLDSMMTFQEFNSLVGLDEIREIEAFYYEDVLKA